MRLFNSKNNVGAFDLYLSNAHATDKLLKKKKWGFAGDISTYT
jgi:hypothetical protein